MQQSGLNEKSVKASALWGKCPAPKLEESCVAWWEHFPKTEFSWASNLEKVWMSCEEWLNWEGFSPEKKSKCSGDRMTFNILKIVKYLKAYHLEERLGLEWLWSREKMMSQVMVLDIKALHSGHQFLSLMLVFTAPYQNLCHPCYVASLHTQCTFLITSRGLTFCFSVQLTPSKSCLKVLNFGCILEIPRELLKILCPGPTARGSNLIG